VCGRIGSESEPVFLGTVAQRVEHESRLDHRSAGVGSIDTTWFICREKSMITAALQHCPARLVPPPRDSTGTPCSRQAATVATTSSTSHGVTTPTGTCR
jgi:hypothetical protein